MFQNLNKNLFRGFSLAVVISLILVTFAWASSVDVAVVDVTVPTNTVTLAPSDSAAITINISVTGNQVGTATFEVYRDWTLSSGTFTGSNSQEFTVAPRAGGDPATNFSTNGTVTVAAGQADGTFTLAIGAFDITNSNSTGGKLAAGTSSNYQVTVNAPPPPSDSTPPVITPNVSGTLGNNGWYVSDVTVSWSVVDNESAISSSSGCGSTTINTDTAGTTLTCTATSAGGTNSASVTIKRDATAPTLTCSTSAQIFLLNQSPAEVSATVTDTGSGPASSTVSSAADTSTVGSKTVIINGYDLAGNSSSTNCSYSVTYAFDGLYQPVDNFIRNGAKAGQAIPLKWRLTDANGDPVLDLTSVTVTAASLSCSLGTTTDQIEEYAAGSSGLQNLGDGYYQFNWKTPKTYASSCKKMSLSLGDGVPHTADFQFTK